MTEKPLAKQKKPGLWRWFIFLPATCIVMYGLSISTAKGVGPNISYQIGAGILPAIIAFVLFYLLVGRRANAISGGLAMILIIAAMVAGSYVGFTRNQQALKQVLRSVARHASQVAALSDQPGRKLPAPKTTTPGDAGIIEAFFKTSINQIAQSQRSYIEAINQVHFDRVLNPEYIPDNKDLAEHFQIIQQTYQLVDRHEMLQNKQFQIILARMNQLKIDPDLKKGIISGYRKSLNQQKKMLKTQWDYERKSLAGLENALRFLDTNQQLWDIENGQFAFYSDESLNTFNKLMNQQQVLAEEQAQFQQKQMNKISQAMIFLQQP